MVLCLLSAAHHPSTLRILQLNKYVDTCVCVNMTSNNSSIYPGKLTSTSRYQGNNGSEKNYNMSTYSLEVNIYSKIAKYVWLIGPPIIAVPGVIGNILTVLVLLRQFGRWSSTAVFLFVLAISDTVQLIYSSMSVWIMYGLDKQYVRQLGNLWCKFSMFSAYAPIHFSSWVLVAVTVERLLSVLWPLRVRQRCTRQIASVASFLILCAVLALNSHFFYGYGLTQNSCQHLYQTYSDFFYFIWPWIDAVVAFAAPFFILVICNSMIIYKLRKAKVKIRKRTIIKSTGEKSYIKDTRSITITLVLLNVVFMISSTPLVAFLISDPGITEEMKLIYAVFSVVSFINAGVNFFLYVLSGAKFRNEVKALLLCRKSGITDMF